MMLEERTTTDEMNTCRVEWKPSKIFTLVNY